MKWQANLWPVFCICNSHSLLRLCERSRVDTGHRRTLTCHTRPPLVDNLRSGHELPKTANVDTPHVSPMKKLAQNTLLVLLSIFVGGVVVECVLRLADPF